MPSIAFPSRPVKGNGRLSSIPKRFSHFSQVPYGNGTPGQYPVPRFLSRLPQQPGVAQGDAHCRRAQDDEDGVDVLPAGDEGGQE